ncbi:hypothetical protein EDD15DRAFT_1665006 [Pisolithus albus]|nr:hypothetical protein EDD15DRAFT_1665006 [Pisolithus albus]
MGTVGPVVINHPCMLCCRPTSMWCSRCRNAWYCTPEHLHTDWPRHCRECIPATYAQNYNMTATPLLAGQQAITRSTTLLEPEEATSISSMEPSAPYNMVSLADSRALMSGIPSFCKSAVIAVKDHGLHADVPNRRSYTLLDGVPVHPEAHRQPTQMQFANCLPSPCSYSDPNSREPPEPIRHGAAPYNFQDVHIIETSTRDVEVGCKQQALGCKLTRDNDIHHMLEFHDNKMLKHHSGPPRLMSIPLVQLSGAFARVQMAENACSISIVALSRPTSKMRITSNT